MPGCWPRSIANSGGPPHFSAVVPIGNSLAHGVSAEPGFFVSDDVTMGAAKKKAAVKETAASKLDRSKTAGEAYICLLCRATFGSTNKKAALMQHCENKHAKNKPEECFAKFPDK